MMANDAVNPWDKKIAKAEQFLKKSREHGRNVYTRYQDNRENDVNGLRRVNIFYSNVNTIKESLFNSLPKPSVSRMHKGDYEDDVSRVAANILQRGLSYEVLCAKSFKEAVESAILDRLVPGTGQVWVRFEQPERLAVDTVYWEDFIYDPARSWSLVKWVGRIHRLTQKEFIDAYGQEAFDQASQVKDDSTITPKELSDNRYCAYEIWDKTTKTVLHIVKGARAPIKTVPDPYSLPDFFPCPCPLIANVATSAFLPVTDYHLAQDQYIELDVLYARMALITKAVKVAGAYDSGATEISRMLEGQENKMIPVDNWAMYAEKGGAKGLIDWYPVEQVVTVYQSLQAQYEFVKATLFEVTGMADIMRGSTNQYETASAQEIKAQFASVRMGGYQRNVSHFVADILRIMSAMMCKLYSDEKFAAIVGQFTEADQQYLAPAMQMLRDNLMRMYKVDIETDSLTQSDWALEKTQRMELTGYIGQFLTSAATIIQGAPEMAPLMMNMLKFSVVGFKGASELEGVIDAQIAALEAAKKEAEENPQPPEPTPEEQKAQAEMQKMEADAAMKERESQQKMDLERMQAEADMATASQKAELEAQMMQKKLEHQAAMNAMEMQMKERELQFKERELQMKLEGQALSAQIKAQSEKESADAKRETSESSSGGDDSD